MKTWQRRFVGILTLAGSGAGIAALLEGIFDKHTTMGTTIVFLVLLCAYAIGIAGGVLILEDSRRMRSLAVPFWAMQMPVVSSPWLVYQLSSGARLDVVLTGEPDLKFFWAAGSNVSLYLLSGAPIAIGVNLVAVFVFWFLVKTSKGGSGFGREP